MSMSKTKKVHYMDVVDKAKAKYDSEEPLVRHNWKDWEQQITLLLVLFAFCVVAGFFHFTLDKEDIKKPDYIISGFVSVVLLTKFIQARDPVQQLLVFFVGCSIFVFYSIKDDKQNMLLVHLVLLFVVFVLIFYQTTASDKNRRLAIENNVRALAIEHNMDPGDAVAVYRHHMTEEGRITVWYGCGSMKLPISVGSADMIFIVGGFLFVVIVLVCVLTTKDFVNQVIIDGLTNAGKLFSRGVTAFGGSLLEGVEKMSSGLYDGAVSFIGGIGSGIGTAAGWVTSFFSTTPESIAATLNNASHNETGQ